MFVIDGKLTAVWNAPRKLAQSPTLFRRVARYSISITQATLALIQSKIFDGLTAQHSADRNVATHATSDTVLQVALMEHLRTP